MSNHLPEIVGFHLDLKYHMPNKQWLNAWLERLPRWGINTLLIEYEDKFPFQKYPFIRDSDAFTRKELETFLSKARGLGMRIIPLIQSFSHLEFALSHKQLAHLREAPEIFNQICPSNPDAVEFVMDLYREVLEYHKEDEFFHCGADEVGDMGVCETCKELMKTNDRFDIWFAHTKKILNIVMQAGKRPIVWDDIFWKDPYRIANCGLPQKTVIHAWNYAIMELGEKNSKNEHNEFGHVSGGNIPQVDIYQKFGYQTLAAPCMNYGQLFPNHRGTVDNTRAWAKKLHQSHMLGMINTSWSSFHVPWQTQNFYLAVTGSLCGDPNLKIDDEYITRWYEDEFSAETTEIASALEPFSDLWEIPMPGYKRKFSPMVYSYMNLILHYKSFEERRRTGSYPLDWDVDFPEVYRKGVENVKKGDVKSIYKRLDIVLASYATAANAFSRMANTSKKRKEEAESIATFAKFKYVSAKVFANLVRGDFDKEQLYRELLSIKPKLENALAFSFEPVGCHRMMRCWWEPIAEALQIIK